MGGTLKTAVKKLIDTARFWAAAVSVALLTLRSFPPACYFKDLQVVYLTARALRDGIYIFTPVADLAARYFPVTVSLSPYPNHLPPLLSLLSIPLSSLPFPVLSFLWLAINLLLLIAVGRMLGLSAVGSVTLAAWPPAFWVLDNGNLEMAILALTLRGWKEARSNRDWQSGLFLGLAAVIKFYPALFLLPFLVRGRLRVVGAAGLIFGLGQLGNLAAVGPAGLVTYCRDILPIGSSLWIHLGLNSAPYGMLSRLFGGAEDIAPLIHAPWLVLPITLALSAFALLAILKLEPEASPLAVLVGLPNVRGYFAVLALPKIVDLLSRNELKCASFISALCVSFTLPLVNLMLNTGSSIFHLGAATHSALACLLASIQTIGFVSLLVTALIIFSKDRQVHPE